MSLKKYITESNRAQSFMVEGDVFSAIVNEELALEFDVVSHTDDSIVIEADEVAMSVLERCGCELVDELVSTPTLLTPILSPVMRIESVEVTTNYSDQAKYHQRMGNKDTAAYYMRKHHAALAESFKLVEDSNDAADAIKRRLMNMDGFSDMVRQHGIDRIIDAIEQEAEFHGDTEELGSSDVSAMVKGVIRSLEHTNTNEAEYQGREVKLSKPTAGDVKKFKVYVKDPKTGNVKKVNFGDPDMEIKRDNPERKKSFRARHGCGTPRASDRTKAAYWSCRMWSDTPVSKIV